MKKLQSKKAQPLSGEGNKRLKKHRPTNNAETAACTNSATASR